ncbi:MAG TPA: DUF2079 domain-containing protein, partial [bacterium]|nr:DUF2079 domain-containing protein [bacterium]
LALPVFYFTGCDPHVLLTQQAFWAASASIPFFLLAAHRLTARSALLLAVAFLLLPALQFGIIGIFAPMPWGFPFILWGLFFLLARKSVPAGIVCLLAAVFTHEAYYYLLLMIAGMFFLSCHRRRDACLLAGTTIIVFVLVKVCLASRFTDDPYMRPLPEIVTKWYGYLLVPGMPLTGRLALAARTICSPISGTLLLNLLLPLACLPLAAPRFAIWAAAAGIPYLLSANPFQKSVTLYYVLLLLPLLAVALIEGIRNIALRFHTPRFSTDRCCAWLVLLAAAIACWYANPFYPVRHPFVYYPGIYSNPLTPSIDAIIRLVPDDVPVLSSMTLAEKLFRRRQLTVLFHENVLRLDSYDYILFNLTDYNRNCDIDPAMAPVFFTRLREHLAAGSFRVRAFSNGILLAERTPAPSPTTLLLSPEIITAFDSAFSFAMQQRGYPDRWFDRPVFFTDALSLPATLTVYSETQITLPIAAGGFITGQPQFSRFSARDETGVMLPVLSPPGAPQLISLAFGALPEGRHTITLQGEYPGGSVSTSFTVVRDTTPPGRTILAGNSGCLFQDALGPLELIAVRNGHATRLTPPLIRMWLGEEHIDQYYPWPGGRPFFSLSAAQLSAFPPGTELVARDLVGNTSRWPAGAAIVD